MTDGELKKRIVENIFDVNWQDGFYTDRDKNPVTEETVLQEIVDSAKKDILEFGGTLETTGEPCLIIHKSKFEKWFGEE